MEAFLCKVYNPANFDREPQASRKLVESSNSFPGMTSARAHRNFREARAVRVRSQQYQPSPNPVNAKRVELRISAENGDIVRECLSRKDTIKRVVVFREKSARSKGHGRIR